MKYEPKVGDYVTVTGRVTSRGLYGMNWVSILGGDPVAVPACGMEPLRDAGEAELRGEVGGPWAIALSEIQDLIEKRVAALEASAKVRDVPATMVNLAHRVQGIEGTIKTMREESRERDDQRRRDLTTIGQRLFQLEQDRDVREHVNGEPVKWIADTGQFMFLPRGRNPNMEHEYDKYVWRMDEPAPQGDWGTARVTEPEPEDADPHADWRERAFVSMDRDGRLALETKADVIAALRDQNNALAERARAAEKMTETIRAANHTMLADLQRAEARVERLANGLRSTRGERSRSEFHRGWAACTDMALATLQGDPYKGPLAVAEPKDPAHGANAQASE